MKNQEQSATDPALMKWIGQMASKHGFGASTSKPVGGSGSVGSMKAANGEVHMLAGRVEADSTGISASGAVAEVKTAEVEARILAGELEVDATGISASGVVAEAKQKGQTDTLGAVEFKQGSRQDGEHWWDGEKNSVVVAKREIDFQEKYDLPEDIVLEADIAVGTASTEALVTDEGLSVGAQANLIEGSVTIGTTGTGDRDEEARIGLSAGEGMAGRVHYADKDGDGNPEYGVGVDVEFVSADIKTEDPVRTAMKTVLPVTGGIASRLIDGNMTNDIIDAGSKVAEKGSELIEQVSDLLSRSSDEDESWERDPNDSRDR